MPRGRCACSGCTSPVRRSITPRRSPAVPTGHVAGVGRSPICFSISSSSSSGSRPGPVVLVEEREHRQPAVAAHLEQLERLGLDALRRVEHHHHGVDAGEHAVGVLGEVLVAGGVEQVDDVLAVRELQHRRADRDAALALELHPVRGRRPPPLAGLHGAGALHRSGVQQELLGQRRLAGVGVGDDRERATPRRFGEQVRRRRVGIHDLSTLSAVRAPTSTSQPLSTRCTAGDVKIGSWGADSVGGVEEERVRLRTAEAAVRADLVLERGDLVTLGVVAAVDHQVGDRRGTRRPGRPGRRHSARTGPADRRR